MIGPALDGGYWLIGMREPHAHLFTDVPWSTDSVRARTVERCNEHAHAYALLDVLTDVDVKDDLDGLALPASG